MKYIAGKINILTLLSKQICFDKLFCLNKKKNMILNQFVGVM